MKLATMAVGATAALLTGGLVWLAVREEKPATKGGSASPTTTTPAHTHASIDRFVDTARNDIMNGGTPGGQTTTPDEPTNNTSPWNHDRGLREGRAGSPRSLHR